VDFLLPGGSLKPWETIELRDRNLRNFTARLGPSGGERGYEGMKKTGSPGYSWYIQGFMTPVMFMQRGITYTFVVEGGNNPRTIDHYHPFIITNEPVGGQTKNQVVLAGIEVTRRGQLQPTAAGTLCIWDHKLGFDRHTDSTILAFEKYRNKLNLACPKDAREPAILDVTPNSSWPDVVYYHSYSQPNMGSKIHIVDNLYGYDYAQHSSDDVDVSGAAAVASCVLVLCMCVSWTLGRLL